MHLDPDLINIDLNILAADKKEEYQRAHASSRRIIWAVRKNDGKLLCCLINTPDHHTARQFVFWTDENGQERMHLTAETSYIVATLFKEGLRSTNASKGAYDALPEDIRDAFRVYEAEHSKEPQTEIHFSKRQPS